MGLRAVSIEAITAGCTCLVKQAYCRQVVLDLDQAGPSRHTRSLPITRTAAVFRSADAPSFADRAGAKMRKREDGTAGV